MSQLSRSTEALAAAAAQALAANRAARNMNRLRGHDGKPPSNPVKPDEIITALIHIHEITGYLAKTVTHYAQAVRWPMAGYYTRSDGDTREAYPTSVLDAAVNAEQALTTLAEKLGYGAPVAFSTDALAGLDIAIADWRTRQRTRAGE